MQLCQVCVVLSEMKVAGGCKPAIEKTAWMRDSYHTLGTWALDQGARREKGGQDWPSEIKPHGLLNGL
jgi:hypothetical protein